MKARCSVAAKDVVWERQYGSVNVYVTYGNWFGEKGYEPLTGGCGIGVSSKGVKKAIQRCMEYAEQSLIAKQESAKNVLVETTLALAALKQERY